MLWCLELKKINITLLLSLLPSIFFNYFTLGCSFFTKLSGVPHSFTALGGAGGAVGGLGCDRFQWFIAFAFSTERAAVRKTGDDTKRKS